MNNSDIESRINHPDNLINRLRLSTFNSKVDSVVSLPIIDVPSSKRTTFDASNPAGVNSTDSATPTIDDLIDDIETKINLGCAHTAAVDVMKTALNELKIRVIEAEKPEQLSKIATDMQKIIAGLAAKNKDKDSDARPQLIIWKPMIVTAEQFNEVHVNE